MGLASHRGRFLGDETPQVGRLAVEREERHQAAHGRHVDERAPLGEGGVDREALPDTSEHAAKVVRACAGAAVGDASERGPSA